MFILIVCSRYSDEHASYRRDTFRACKETRVLHCLLYAFKYKYNE